MSIGGAGFKIVHSGHGSPMVYSYPVAAVAGTANTVYEGQLVKYIDGSGIAPLGTFTGNTTQATFPFGVVVGLNNRTPVSNATYGNYGTQQITQATELARDFFGSTGMFNKSDPQLTAKVALIDPSTVVEAPIFKSAYGTAMGVLTVTTANSAGTTMVHNSADMTTIANQNIYYCRTGLNAGLYRGSNSTSATTPTFLVPFPYAIAVGDTFVASSVGLGRQLLNIDSIGMYVDNANALANYCNVDVIQVDLSTAGQERIQFRFAFH